MNRYVWGSLFSFLLFIALSGQTMGGTHGFLYSEGTFTTLDVPGSPATSAYAINDDGQVVGGFTRPGEPGEAGQPTHAYLYSIGTFTTLDVPGSISEEAFGINNTGQIVGRYNSSSDNRHGFLLTDKKFMALDAWQPLHSSLRHQ